MDIPEQANNDASLAEAHLKRWYPELADVCFGEWENGPDERWAFKRAKNRLALLVFSPEIGVQEVHGDIGTAWIRTGGPDGPLGLPITWEEGSWEERWGNFQTGKIRWTRDGCRTDIYTPDPNPGMGCVVSAGLTWPSAPGEPAATVDLHERGLVIRWQNKLTASFSAFETGEIKKSSFQTTKADIGLCRFLPDIRQQRDAALNKVETASRGAREADAALSGWRSFDRNAALREIEQSDNLIRILAAERDELEHKSSEHKEAIRAKRGQGHEHIGKTICNWFSSVGESAMALMLDMKARTRAAKLHTAQESKNRVESSLNQHDSFDWISAFFHMGTALAKYRLAVLSLLRADTVLHDEIDRIKPVADEIRNLENELSFSSDNPSEIDDAILEADCLDRQLNDAANATEKWKIHSECERLFGVGSPRRACGLLRTKKKLIERIRNIGDKTSNVVHKVLVDGSNIRPERPGFNPRFAVAIANELATRFETILFFDALWGDSLRTVKRALKENVKLSVMHGTKADEIILAMAEGDPGCFIVSNDRFRDYFDKDAVKNHRILRHEIVNDDVFVPRLEIRAKVMAS